MKEMIFLFVLSVGSGKKRVKYFFLCCISLIAAGSIALSAGFLSDSAKGRGKNASADIVKSESLCREYLSLNALPQLLSARKIIIPEQSSGCQEYYDRLRESGCDLSEYSGKDCILYTYSFTDNKGDGLLSLYVRDREIIAAEKIYSADADVTALSSR